MAPGPARAATAATIKILCLLKEFLLHLYYASDEIPLGLARKYRTEGAFADPQLD